MEGKIRKFIRDTGFLSITDLEEGRYEQPEFIKSELAKRGKRYAREVFEERQESYLKRRINLHEYCESRHALVNAPKTSAARRRRRELLEFIRLASDFNERNRVYRSHLLRLFRTHYQQNAKDCRNLPRQEAYA